MPHPDYEDDIPDLVIIKEEGVIGLVIDYGAHVSTVLYCVGGLMFEEIMENDEFEPLEVDE